MSAYCTHHHGYILASAFHLSNTNKNKYPSHTVVQYWLENKVL